MTDDTNDLNDNIDEVSDKTNEKIDDAAEALKHASDKTADAAKAAADGAKDAAETVKATSSKVVEHVKRNKNRYIIGGVAVAAVGVSVIVFKKVRAPGAELGTYRLGGELSPVKIAGIKARDAQSFNKVMEAMRANTYVSPDNKSITFVTSGPIDLIRANKVEKVVEKALKVIQPDENLLDRTVDLVKISSRPVNTVAVPLPAV